MLVEIHASLFIANFCDEKNRIVALTTGYDLFLVTDETGKKLECFAHSKFIRVSLIFLSKDARHQVTLTWSK